MPADYESTARALSLPVSEPEETESPLFAGIRPPWSQAPLLRRSSLPLSAREAVSFRDRMIDKAETMHRTMSDRWRKMTLKQKLVTVLGGILSVAVGLAFMIFAGRVFVWLGPVAEKWEHAPLAYFLVWVSVIVVSFPPMVGWSTLGTISGFLFGFWKGYVHVYPLVLCFAGRVADLIPLQMDSLFYRQRSRLNPLYHTIAHGALEISPAVTGKRQEICGASTDTQIRRPQTLVHDSTMSVAVFNLQRCHVDVSHCPAAHVRAGDGDYLAKIHGSCFHWQPHQSALGE